MKITLLLISACVVLAGCSSGSSTDVAGTAPPGTTAGSGPSGPASTNENSGQGASNVHIVHSPSEIPEGTHDMYKIVPADPSKFPSNAAGGDH